MKIHWRLIKEYIKNADTKPDGCREASACEECLIENKDCVNCKKGCVKYVSCGPFNRCKRPCKYCLYWTGYGLDYEDQLEENGVII